MTKPIPALLAALLFAPGACAAQHADAEADAVHAAASITTEDFARRVGVIADDSMKGRDTPSAGLDRTAEWIASEFRRLGLRGGADDGGFIQRYPLVATTVDVDASGIASRDGRRLAFGPDVLPFRLATEGTATGGLVLAAGIGDDAASLAQHVRGEHVAVLLPGTVAGSRRSRFALLGAILRAGAASVLVVSDEPDDRWEFDARDALEPRVRRVSAEADPEAAAPPFAPMLQVRAGALDRLLAGTGLSVADMRAGGVEPWVREVPGVELTLRMTVSERQTSAPNVVGILDGSDPGLEDEYVVFSGHMDHVGVGAPDQNGDSIFNGADDDASGTVGVIEVAEAMATLGRAPRRSTMFVLVSGEEKGLWGSEWFTSHPPVPMDRMVADFNTDMIGRNWPDTIVAIGREHSDLGETLGRVNAAHPELGMTAIDDIWPEESFYTRSDHYNFATKGVPILFFFNGTHADYHGRDDEPERIDAEKAARIARLVFWLGLDVANADARPRWNPESRRRIVSDGAEAADGTSGPR